MIEMPGARQTGSMGKLMETLKRTGIVSSVNDAQRMAQEITSTERKVHDHHMDVRKECEDYLQRKSHYHIPKDVPQSHSYHPPQNAEASQQAEPATKPVVVNIPQSREKESEVLDGEKALQELMNEDAQCVYGSAEPTAQNVREDAMAPAEEAPQQSSQEVQQQPQMPQVQAEPVQEAQQQQQPTQPQPVQQQPQQQVQQQQPVQQEPVQESMHQQVQQPQQFQQPQQEEPKSGLIYSSNVRKKFEDPAKEHGVDVMQMFNFKKRGLM